MLILECTKKLADELKVSLQNIIPMGSDPFYSWHANLFTYNGRKCAILMNDKTRFCFILYGLKKEHFKDFGKVVLDAMVENCTAEGFEKDIIEKYIHNSGTILYTKTSDRSTLGQMNDMVFMATQVYLEDFLVEDKLNQIEVNKTLNRAPMVKWKYLRGFEGMKEELLKI
jgi:hypothetical protein